MTVLALPQGEYIRMAPYAFAEERFAQSAWRVVFDEYVMRNMTGAFCYVIRDEWEEPPR